MCDMRGLIQLCGILGLAAAMLAARVVIESSRVSKLTELSSTITAGINYARRLGIFNSR